MFMEATGPVPPTMPAATSNASSETSEVRISSSVWSKWRSLGSLKMRQRRETVEHPFGTIKARMGATHFLMKTLPRVASEMALHVLAYNPTRVMNIMGIQPLMAAMRA